MKIGILTFHYGANYGGVLQCYALQEILKQNGHDVYIINYIPHNWLKNLIFCLIHLLKKKDLTAFKSLYRFVMHSHNSIRIFREFRKQYLNETFKSSNINKFNKIDFDAIIVGSDQIWNYQQQKRKIYFLEWVKNTKCKKISYAACCARYRIYEKKRHVLKENLSKFDAISVRSLTTSQFVYDISHRSSTLVADPTLLYNFKNFICKKNDNYILTYIITDDIKGGNVNIINKIKNYYPGLPIYSIVISHNIPRICNWADKQLFDISPNEWVNLIANCNFFITDSFHGTLFALKYEKPFIAYYNNDIAGQRFKDMEKSFGLKNVITHTNEIDYVIQNKLWERNSFKNYIKEISCNSLKFINDNTIKKQ